MVRSREGKMSADITLDEDEGSMLIMDKMVGLARQAGDRMLAMFVPQVEAKAVTCKRCYCDSDAQGGDWCCDDPCQGSFWCVRGC
jgi:hypothetical protein